MWHCLWILAKYFFVNSLFLPVPPMFTKSPMNQTIPKGQTASFSCLATGDPPPLIKWFKSQNSISNDLHFSILPNGTLVINNVSEQDSGWFTCRATSAAGTVEKMAYLLVAGMENVGYKEGWPKYTNQWAGFLHSFLMMPQIAVDSLDPGFKEWHHTLKGIPLSICDLQIWVQKSGFLIGGFWSHVMYTVSWLVTSQTNTFITIQL